MALSVTNKRQRTEGSESAGEPCSNGDHNLIKRLLALVPRPSYQSGDFVAVRHDDDPTLNCIFKSWDGAKHHMDAISGEDFSHASFETIEDAAAYAFGDGGNGNAGDAIDASLTVAATTAVVVKEVDEPLTRDFSDEIWFIVLQFLFGVNIDKFMRPVENEKKPFTV